MTMNSTFSELFMSSARGSTTGWSDWYRNVFNPAEFSHEFTEELAKRYTYLYSENDPESIYFAYKHYWYSVQEMCPVYGTEKEDGQPVTIDAPVIKSIWVQPSHRNRGIQSGILKELTGLASKVFTPIVAFISPFEPFCRSDDILQTMDYFNMKPYKKSKCEDVKEKQRSRFRSHGFINHVYPHFRETEPKDHMLYVPEEYPVEFSSSTH